MNWRICTIVLIELAFTLFPANIIGCVDPPDPYDDYISFFRNDLAPDRAYEPFYYVNEEVLYDPMGTDSSIDHFAPDWARYCGISSREAARFIYKSDLPEIDSLWQQLRGIGSPASRHDPMAVFLLQHRDTAAVKYLQLVKQAEQYTDRGGKTWSDRTGWYMEKEDSTAMSRLIEAAVDGFRNTRSAFLRARYGFQAVRLAFYDRHPADCIRFYDAMVKNNPASGHLQRDGLGYVGGALLQLDKRREAAYAYSRSFSAHPNTSDYMSFNWCVHRFDAADRDSCMAVCRTDREKGNMLGLFLLGSNVPEAASLRRMDRLGAGSAVQEVLAVREVNKIERSYLTPWLRRQKGGLALNELYWTDEGESEDQLRWLDDAKELTGFYDSLTRRTGKGSSSALFETVAAQLGYITRRFGLADSLLERAAALPASQKIRDQQSLTRLLVTISERSVIDSAVERRLLSSIKWLRQKAEHDSVRTLWGSDYDEHIGIWRQMYRNLLSVVLAKRYHQQREGYKEALCIGAAERLAGGAGFQTEGFLEDQMSTRDLRILLGLINGSDRTHWETYLSADFPVGADKIRCVLAVSATRDHHFREALKWMGSIKDPKLLELGRNPFADLLLDRQDTLYPFDKGQFDKRRFLSEMARLADRERLGSATSKDFYRLALGYYNMTYYGRAWDLVKYDRSGADWDYRPEYKIPFDRDYYECNTAEAYFGKAMNASADRDLKARCLFMMAKCAQKQIPLPSIWPGGGNMSDEQYAYLMRHNNYFPQLVRDYAGTAFYREAYTTCSYLRDFVLKK